MFVKIGRKIQWFEERSKCDRSFYQKHSVPHNNSGKIQHMKTRLLALHGNLHLVAWSRHTAPRQADRLAVGWVAGEGAFFCLSGTFESVD